MLVARGQAKAALKLVSDALVATPKEPQLSAAAIEVTEKVLGVPATIDRAVSMADPTGGPLGRLRRAALYSKYGRDQEAIALLKVLATETPTETAVWAQLSAAEARLGHQQEAAAALERLIKLVPMDAAALVALGTLYKKLGRTDQARQAYEASLQVEPNSLIPLNNLAGLLTGQAGQAKRAVALARQARAIATQNAAVAETLGWALVNTGAAEDLTEGLKLLRDSSRRLNAAEAYYHYGVALRRAGKTGEATSELRQALDTSKDFSGAADARRALEELSRAK